MMQWLEPSLLSNKTVLSVGCAVKTDLSSVPEERTEETYQPTNQQSALTGLVGQRANQCTAATFTLAPIPKQTRLIESPIPLFLFCFSYFCDITSLVQNTFHFGFDSQ